MEKSITRFSPETCNQINYYVDRLVDPRNGQTFYVGKGKNNRIFAHVEWELNRYSDVDYSLPAGIHDEGGQRKGLRPDFLHGTLMEAGNSYK